MTHPLTPRQRVGLTLTHQEPDRVPINVVYHWRAYQQLRAQLCLPQETLRPDIWGRIWESADLVQALGTDCINMGPQALVSGPGFDYWRLKEHKDHFGVQWRKVTNPTGEYFEMVDYPFKAPDLEALDRFAWPNPDDPIFDEPLSARVQQLHQQTDLAIVLLLTTHIWERAIYMCGFEAWWIYLIEAPLFCRALLQRIADFQRAVYMRSIEATGKYATILRLGGEDFGTQRGLMISPSTFREMVMPVLASVYQPLKARYLALNPSGKIMLHSDGAVSVLIPDFIHLGIDVLDPVQPQAEGMAGRDLKQQHRGQISFHGGVDTQHTLPFGDQKKIEAEVQKRISSLGRGGGYILAPSHSVQPDVPVENLISMVQAAKEHGRYPIAAF